MNVKQLKEQLGKFSDDSPVVVIGHDPEGYGTFYVVIREVRESGNFIPTVYVDCS